MREIVITHVCPPIPYRGNDFCAHYEGEEEAGGYGWGATPDEARADFLDNCAEAHDERLAWRDPRLVDTELREARR